MGIVYEALQVSLGRHVALKVLPFHRHMPDNQLERFRREARAAARLHHTNIVPVFGVGECESVHFYAMQFIRGQNLDSVLRELRRLRDSSGSPLGDDAGGSPDVSLTIAQELVSGRLSSAPPNFQPAANDGQAIPSAAAHATAIHGQRVESAPPTSSSHSDLGSDLHYYRSVARIGVQVAEALAYAHAHGVLHRDIKPSNILLDTQGTAWITDFGLAKVEGLDELTSQGDIVGTLRYMPPERFRGQANERGDVYGLGLTLYELLTLRPAFAESERARLIERVLNEALPRPRGLDRRIPRDLETIVLAASAKEPGQRYASAGALAEDLRRFLAGRPIRARRAPSWERAWLWCRRNPAVAGLTLAIMLLLMTVAVGSTLAARRQYQAAEENRRLLVRQYLAAGTRRLDEGDPLGTLPWFVEALRREGGEADRELPHRLRLGMLLESCPRLVQCWRHTGGFAAFDSAGRRVLNAGEDGTARVWDVTTGDLLLTLRHGANVWHAAFSPDGQRVVTAGDDGTTRLWDADTGQLQLTLGKHRAAVRRAALSSDGTRVVTASEDGTGRLWDAATGEPIGTLQHEAKVWYAAFSPDGRLVVTASDDSTARLWNAVTGAPLTGPLPHQRRSVFHAAFSADGTRLVTAGRDGARVWETETGALVRRLEHGEMVWRAAFSPDGARIVTSSYDGMARIWNVHSGAQIVPPLKHDALALHAEFSPNGRRIVTTSDDGTARVWDAATGAPQATLQHGGPVQWAGFSPDGTHVLTASDDGTARLWAVSVALPRLSLGHPAAVRFAAFTSDGRCVVTAGEDGTARLWNTATGALRATLPHGAVVTHAAFSPDDRRVVTGGGDGAARVWDVDTGASLHTLNHDAAVWHVAYSPDGRRIVSASGAAPTTKSVNVTDRVVQAIGPGAARVWDAETGKPLCPPLRHDKIVLRAAFSPDGAQVVTAGGDGQARLWDAVTGALRLSMPHPRYVTDAAFSPDGRCIATAGYDTRARLWDARSGAQLTPPLAHGRSLSHIEFSPDGARVLTASDDGTARVWDAASGAPLTPPLAHRLPLWQATFSADGRWIVTASDDQTARVWDAATGTPLTPPIHQGVMVYHACFSPDGRRIVIARDDGQAQILEIVPDNRPVGDLVALAQVLSGRRVHAAGDLMPVEPDVLLREWKSLKARYPRQFAAAAGD
jgi:WD40 repeat protein/serine/threonine protein kinase